MRSTILVLAVTVLCFIATLAAADEVNNLKGITGFGLRVSVDDTAQKMGLDEAGTLKAVRLALRKARLPVREDDDVRKIPGSPVLLVTIKLFKDPRNDAMLAFSVQIEMVETVSLARNATARAATWSRGDIGMVGAAMVPLVKRTVNNTLDGFVDAFLDANPDK